MHSIPIVALLLAASLQAQIRNPHTSPEDIEAGGRIYRSHCADCHGLNGQGGKGPDLTSGQYFHGSSDEVLHKNITDGIPGTAMPSQFFSADQVWQIVAFVRTLAAKGSAQAPAGDAAEGAKVFRSKGCVNCHLVRGEGGVNGPDLSYVGSQRPVSEIRRAILEPNALVDMAYWQADIVMENGTPYRGFLLNEDTYNVQMLHPAKGLLTLPKKDFRKYAVVKTSIMPSYQGRLQDTELQNLVAYLWSLQRPRRVE